MTDPHKEALNPYHDSLEYSMDDSGQRFAFPKGQNTYGGAWWMIADELAQDYFDKHDGWESQWPLTLRIFSRDEQVAAFTVEMERVPEFHAYEIEDDSSMEADRKGGQG